MMQRRTEPDRAALALRPLALAYRLTAVALIATGLVRLIGVFEAAPEWNTLLYYTGMSNLLCLVWMVLLLVRTVADLRRSGIRGTSTPSARLSGAVMMAITVTMLIYLIVLVPDRLGNTGEDAPFTLTDNLVHIITPCLIIGDWLFFVAKGSFRWRDPLLWAITPYAYLVFAFTFSAAGGEFKPGQRYPYPFMNLDVLGLGGVATWIAALTVALIAVGFVYVVLDRLLGRLGTRRGH